MTQVHYSLPLCISYVHIVWECSWRLLLDIRWGLNEQALMAVLLLMVKKCDGFLIAMF